MTVLWKNPSLSITKTPPFFDSLTGGVFISCPVFWVQFLIRGLIISVVLGALGCSPKVSVNCRFLLPWIPSRYLRNVPCKSRGKIKYLPGFICAKEAAKSILDGSSFQKTNLKGKLELDLQKMLDEMDQKDFKQLRKI